jgi:hypothetical protein
MGISTSCARCGRRIEDVPEQTDEVVCIGCLTGLEDCQETGAIIALLKRRYSEAAETGSSAAEGFRRATARVLENLDARRFGPVDLGSLPPGVDYTAEPSGSDLLDGPTMARRDERLATQ